MKKKRHEVIPGDLIEPVVNANVLFKITFHKYKKEGILKEAIFPVPLKIWTGGIRLWESLKILKNMALGNQSLAFSKFFKKFKEISEYLKDFISKDK